MKTENKVLSIFLLVAFGLPFLMGIPLSIIQGEGKDTTVFATVQMFYPAAAFMLSQLIVVKDKSLMPKKFFIGFLILSATMFMWSFTSFFLTTVTVLTVMNSLMMGGSIIVGIIYFIEKKEKRLAFGLVSKNWKVSTILLLVYLFLYYLRAGVFFEEPEVILEILSSSAIYFPMLLFNFVLVFTAFLGEEYGWRFYFQPLLQKKFGLIKGVIVFGVLWGLWHMPLNMFFYAPETALQSISLQLITCISLGIFFAYAYMKTENLWLAVLLHFFNNNLIVLMPGYSGIANQEYNWEMVAVAALVNFAVFLPFLFSKVFRKQITTQKEQTS